jgi:hypothetical protein
MKTDEFILQALQGEAVTVSDIGKRFESHVRLRLSKLRVRCHREAPPRRLVYPTRQTYGRC